MGGVEERVFVVVVKQEVASFVLFALETDCGLPRHALPSNCLVDFLSCCLVNRCSEMDF